MSTFERLCERATPLGKGRGSTRYGWRMEAQAGEAFVATLATAEARDNWVKAVRVMLEAAGRKLAPPEIEPVAAAAAMTLQHGPFSPAGRRAEEILADYRVRLPLALVEFWGSDVWTVSPMKFTRALSRALDEVMEEARLRSSKPGLAHILPPARTGQGLGVTR